MTNYAQIKEHFAYLSDDFGLETAIRWSGMTEEELAEKLGRYSRGKRAGKIRGKLVWKKAVKGGWFRTGHYDDDRNEGHGYVIKRNACFEKRVVDWEGETLLSFADDLRADKERRNRHIDFEIQQNKEILEETTKRLSTYRNEDLRKGVAWVRGNYTEKNVEMLRGWLHSRNKLRAEVRNLSELIANLENQRAT